jgi:RNA-directed DNA polymerase
LVAFSIKKVLVERFATCSLELQPDKTRIVYGKDSSRIGEYPQAQFTFLGFTFRPCRAMSRTGKLYVARRK